MEVVMLGPTLALFSPSAWQLSLLVCDVLMMRGEQDKCPEQGGSRERIVVFPGLLRKQGESADMSLASQDCVWAIKSYLSLLRLSFQGFLGFLYLLFCFLIKN